MYTLLSSAGCRQCGKVLRGRSDKQFCDDYCRNQFNNRLNRDHHLIMRKVHNILRRNKKILEEIRQQGCKRISQEQLRQQGFSFRHCTGVVPASEGSLMYYCYDEAYRLVNEEVEIANRE